MKTFSRLFAALIFAAMAGCSASQESITGFVQATETDENDNPTDIYLFDGSNDYTISKSEVRGELFDLLDRKIKATGTVSESWGGKKQIEIEEYKVVD